MGALRSSAGPCVVARVKSRCTNRASTQFWRSQLRDARAGCPTHRLEGELQLVGVDHRCDLGDREIVEVEVAVAVWAVDALDLE